MTYGEAIEKKMQEAEKIYDDCEALRDVANETEKDHWNNLRRLLLFCDDEFKKLNVKAHATKRIDMKLKGTY